MFEDLTILLDQERQIDEIDGTIIGPYDLSGSMGKPGKYDEPDVLEALKTYESISKNLGKPFGFHIIQPDHKLVLDKIKSGYSIIAFSLDTLFLGTLCRDEMNSLRKHIS